MKNNKKTLNFKTKDIRHSFTANNITSYAGTSSIMKYLRREKFGFRINNLFETIKHNATKFSNAQLMLSVILASLCGINRMSRIANFTNDCLIKHLLGLEKGINKDVIGLRFKRLGQRGAIMLHEFSMQKVREWLTAAKIHNITVDMDSTVKTVYGSQEGAAKGYNPEKKGAKSYHPILAFCSNMKIIVNTWFRTGSSYTSNGICEFVNQTAMILPSLIKSVFLRADSGFFNGQLFDLLEKMGWKYLIKAKFKGLKKLLEIQRWIKCENNPNMSYCEFDYKGFGWSKTRKLRAVRRVKEMVSTVYFGKIQYVPVYEYACYCSNLSCTVEDLHACYRERSTSETWIEQVKSQLLAGHTLTNNFHANDILWQLNVMAYNISVVMRYKFKKERKEEHNTFRDWFILVPAKIVSGSRQLHMQISENYYMKDKWQLFEEQLVA